MTPDEAEKAIEFFRATWPQSNRWPPETWLYWTDLFLAHGRSYVRIALKRLIYDEAFREFPPGLAAFVQEFDKVEGYLRDRLRNAREDLARAEELDDGERAAKITDWIASAEERLAQ